MARTSTPSTIILHGEDNARDRKDGVAQSAITPGQLVEVTGTVSGSTTKQIDVHSSAAADTVPRFALEYSHTGGGIDDDYAVDDHMEYRTFKPGEEVNAFLAAGENVSEGATLVADGSGNLRLIDTSGGDAEGVAVAEALESVDNSGGSSAVRIRAEVM